MMRPCKPQIYHFFLEGRPEPERWRTQACSGSSGRPRSWDLRPPRLSFFRANISLERKKKHYECNANPRSCDSETTLASCLPTVVPIFHRVLVQSAVLVGASSEK